MVVPLHLAVRHAFLALGLVVSTLWFLSLQVPASDVGQSSHQMWKPAPFVEVDEFATYAFWARCDAPASREDADICQQWRMAVAAEKSAEYARLSYSVVGLISLSLLAAAALFAQRAATWAKAAAMSGDIVARESELSTVAAQRTADAMIGLELPVIRSQHVPAGIGEQIEGQVKTHTVSIRDLFFRNYGRTQALLTRIRIGSALGEKNSFRPEYSVADDIPPNGFMEPEPQKEPTRYNANFSCELTPDEWARVLADNSSLWLFAELEYLDFLGDYRAVELAWRFEHELHRGRKFYLISVRQSAVQAEPRTDAFRPVVHLRRA